MSDDKQGKPPAEQKPASEPEQEPEWRKAMRELEARMQDFVRKEVGAAGSDVDKMKGWVRREMDLAARGIKEHERMEKHNP